MDSILLVEDDKSFGYVLSEYLKLKNYNVIWKETASAAIKEINNSKFDLVILDINLKNATGFEVAHELKEIAPETPFIFLTARDLKIDQLKGYQLGAEEYITKPIDEEILTAKITTIINRKKEPNRSDDEISYKHIFLNIRNRELKVKSETYQLTEREALLMQILISQPENLVKRKDILRKLWDNQDEFSRNSMDVYISRLRKYISHGEISIRNIHGKGFILESIE